MPTDLIVPDTSRLSPRDRLSWAQAVLHQFHPSRPQGLFLGAEVLRRAAQTELNLLHQSHPHLFSPPPLLQDNRPPNLPKPA